MKYDKRDKIILENLYHNWRISSSKLSRKIKLSRRQVDYRIKQYFSSGIVRAIFSVFNYSKLGFAKPAYLFFTLKNKEEIKEIGEYLERSKRCTSWGRAWTEYDLFSNFIFKDKKEMNSFVKMLKIDFANKFDKIELIDPIYAELYPLKPLGSSVYETYILTQDNSKKIKLDSVDIRIIQELAKDSRKSLIEIAGSIKISPERLLYRLRKLVRDKIILGSRIQFNLSKAGYFATCLFVQSDAGKESLEKIKRLCKEEISINYLIISKKSPRVIIQLFHKDENTIRTVIKKVNSALEGTQSKISIVQLEDDINIVNPLPFL